MSEPLGNLNLQQIYRDAVDRASNYPVFHIDPNSFASENIFSLYEPTFEDYFKVLETDWNEQYPERHGELAAEIEADPFKYTLLIDSAIKIGPFAAPDDEMCIVNGLSSENFYQKEGLVSYVTGFHQDFLKPIPGEITDYVTYIAYHEAQHCNQNPKLYSDANVLVLETDADQFSLDSGDIPLEVEQTIVHSRSINPSRDPTHATAIQLEDSSITEDYTAEELYQTAQYSDIEISMKLDAVLRQGYDSSKFLESENPPLYYQFLDAAIAAGEFDNHPLLREYADAHSTGTQALIRLDEINPEGKTVDTAIEQRAAIYVDCILHQQYNTSAGEILDAKDCSFASGQETKNYGSEGFKLPPPLHNNF